MYTYIYIPQGINPISVYDATTVSQKKRNALTCFNKRFRKCQNINFLYFSNCDDQHHKPNNFEIAALDSSCKLNGFCI